MARSWSDVCRTDSGRADKSLRFRREGSRTESRGREVKCRKCGRILVTFALEDPPRKPLAKR